VKIPAFRKDTAGALKQALVEAKAKSPKSLIIDVRGAIGGDVADAVPCAALFTGPGVIAKPVSRKLVLQPLEAGEKAEKAWSGKTVVLIDDATGGAAEVFAAAIHDRASAVTVGETTVGMAIVQRQVPTEAGGTLSMTVARYVSPSGTVLAGKGMSPDDRVIVFPDRTGASTPANPSQDPILERGLEVARGAVPGRRAA
jgi:carboxyl-terminal processing protease